MGRGPFCRTMWKRPGNVTVCRPRSMADLDTRNCKTSASSAASTVAALSYWISPCRAGGGRSGCSLERPRHVQRSPLLTQSKSPPSCCRSAPTCCADARMDSGMSRAPKIAGRAARKIPAFSRPMVSTVAAEPVAMIEIDRGHHRDVGIDDVDGVEPPAQADFEHDCVGLSVREYQQRGQRVELEERERLCTARRVDALERRHQRRVGDFDAVDGNALVVAKQMRRGERTDAIAGSARMRAAAQHMSPCRSYQPTVITGHVGSLASSGARACVAGDRGRDRSRSDAGSPATRAIRRARESHGAKRLGAAARSIRPCLTAARHRARAGA